MFKKKNKDNENLKKTEETTENKKETKPLNKKIPVQSVDKNKKGFIIQQMNLNGIQVEVKLTGDAKKDAKELEEKHKYATAIAEKVKNLNKENKRRLIKVTQDGAKVINATKNPKEAEDLKKIEYAQNNFNNKERLNREATEF